jgi:hypothetical protein
MRRLIEGLLGVVVVGGMIWQGISSASAGQGSQKNWDFESDQPGKIARGFISVNQDPRRQEVAHAAHHDGGAQNHLLPRWNEVPRN